MGRLRLASKDRESIADMKTQVDVAIKPFSCGRRVSSSSALHRLLHLRFMSSHSQVARRADWDDSKQILARILQRYRNGVVTGHSSTSGAAVCAAHAASASESTEDRALLPVVSISFKGQGYLSDDPKGSQYCPYIQRESLCGHRTAGFSFPAQ